MTRYIIRYNRAGCIGAISCAAVQPTRWVMAEDGKADLVGGKRVGDGDFFEAEIDESELKAAIDAVQVCPTSVIEVYKVENGMRIIVPNAIGKV